MNILISVALLWCCLNFSVACFRLGSVQTNPDEPQIPQPSEDVDRLNGSLARVARQLMLQQLYVEERTRSEGDSGLKTVRLRQVGAKSYHSETHSSSTRIAAIHNHANGPRTVGMGEFIAVLNGVEFRTRHNDYILKMPSTSTTNYHITERIPFPDVPPQVLQHTKVEDQITEMRQWFKAFKDQNTTLRDYRPYFKPVLCYLEGAWTTSTDEIEESFESNRHFLDADSWHELQEKIRFNSYTGRKDPDENLAYLPTTIMDLINGSIPVLAQWNYRILCHPLNRDVPLNSLQVQEDLASRITARKTRFQYERSGAARFRVKGADPERLLTNPYSEYSFLDLLMSEVPGKDNYPANITEDVWEGLAYPYEGENTSPLNVGYYHRAYKTEFKDAMGINKRRRSYNDRNLFMAATTNSKIAPITVTTCHDRHDCRNVTERWTYAIPLEIIYTTPLSSWNPYNIEFKGLHWLPSGQAVTAGGRNGQLNIARAYNGTNTDKFFMTPRDFFSDEEMVMVDAADTTGGVKGVLNRDGELKAVQATGIRIFLPRIPGVGVIRQRYPIMPIHGEGSTMYKELDALKDIVLHPDRYQFMYR